MDERMGGWAHRQIDTLARRCIWRSAVGRIDASHQTEAAQTLTWSSGASVFASLAIASAHAVMISTWVLQALETQANGMCWQPHHERSKRAERRVNEG